MSTVTDMELEIQELQIPKGPVSHVIASLEAGIGFMGLDFMALKRAQELIDELANGPLGRTIASLEAGQGFMGEDFTALVETQALIEALADGVY